jgi:hypothetical protein
MNAALHLLVIDATGAAAAYLGYLFVLRRLANVAQPYRLQLAELGERILAHHPARDRAELISFYLDHAFSGWVALFAALALPFVALTAVLESASRRPPPNPDDKRMSLLFAVSAYAANPLFGTVLAAELFVITLLLVMLSGPQALARAMVILQKAEQAVPRWAGQGQASLA